MKTAFRLSSQKEDSTQVNISNSANLGALIERIGSSRYVLLGEASHGTHEYYIWRTEITKRLIQEKGFSFIAVEGDWPDCYKINRFIKGYPDAGIKVRDVLHSFKRWPTWMWANWEIAALTEWLAEYNREVSTDKKAGFYGLDVYSLWESMDAVAEYLEKEDPTTARTVKKAIECFEPYNREGQEYAVSTYQLSSSCSEELVKLLKEIRSRMPSYDSDREAPMNVEQNAAVAVNAEKYYRAMISFGPESWNVRDFHMTETLNRLMKFHGTDSKAIVWEHNTHVGDARATEMRRQGMLNLGQLVREQHQDEGVFIVGFGSYKGTVIAGEEWGAPMEIMTMPEAKFGSLEDFLHKTYGEDTLLLLNEEKLPSELKQDILHRAVGVVYHPHREKYGNYVRTFLPARYDAFIYFEETKALHPMHIKPNGHLMPDTYPFAL